MNEKAPPNGNAPSATQVRSRKINPKKVAELAQRGLRPGEIAEMEGVHRTTVWRFLRQLEPERQSLELFKTHRADALARIQAKSIDVQERILDTMDDGIVAALKPGQKTGTLIALNAILGTSFDKERLERGESTQNVSVMSRMVDGRVKQLYKRKATSSQSEEPVHQAE